MNRVLVSLIAASPALILGCGGTAGPAPGSSQPSAPQPAAETTSPVSSGAGGVQIDLTIGGGSHEGNWNLSHANPCQYNLPSDGDWRLTVTFPGAAATDPSIVDMELVEGEGYIEPWFGDESVRAEDVTFTVDDRGADATLTAAGTTSSGVPVDITVECDYIARY